jgi:type IV secretion system protein VirD4
MSEPTLLLGWPLVDTRSSTRHFAASRRPRRFADIQRADHYRRDGHLITFAPTGAGKGVRVIIPNLLHYSGPVIVVDPKGENFAVTARYRSEVLKQRIFVLDPFEVVSPKTLADLRVERATLNPLDLVSVRGHLGPQLTMLASVLSTRKGPGDFWDQGAQKLLAGALGAAVALARRENKPISFQRFIDYLTSDDVVYGFAVLLDTAKDLDKVTYKGISSFLQRADKERSGVLSTALSYLTPFISEEINRYLDTSSIQSRMVLNDDDYTIYIIIPPAKLISHATLLQLWIATLLNAIMERGAKPLKRTLFLLDECAQLGKLEALTKAVTLLRGYGLQVWMFFQDLSQLEETYGQGASTIINNCAVLQSFGLTRTFAAQPIASAIGKYEPDDLVQLDKTQQVLSSATAPPKITRLMNYLKDEAFAGRWDPNPLFEKHVTKRLANETFPPNAVRIHI